MSDNIANLRDALLPLALQLGYTDVQVGADLNKFGYNYWASAHSTYGTTTLANILDYRTPEAMLNAAMSVLYAELGCVASL